MDKHRQQLTREELAQAEVGVTTVSRRTAMLLAALFLLTIALVPLHQILRDRSVLIVPESLSLNGDFFTINRTLLRFIKEQDDRIANDVMISRWLRPPVQWFMSKWLGAGNEQVYPGRDGWLFYRPGFDHVTGKNFLDPREFARRTAAAAEWTAPPHPDPRPAILDFHQQLAARGITLVVMPTPVKPAIHPEHFRRGLEGPRANAGYISFIRELASAGVTIFDPTEILLARKPDGPQFLATDTHWRPEAMEAVARALAEQLVPHLEKQGRARRPAEPRTSFALIQKTSTITATGDITPMLDLPAGQTLYPPESVTIQQVLTADQQFWTPDADAEVLLLGDSFSNIYSLEALGWGESAGFAEQLSYHLQAPVDRIARNDSGAFATRDMLSRELARGHDRLAGKKIVIWQFAVRELSLGDWRIVPMKLMTPPPSSFITLAPGSTMKVTGTVQEISRVPRPGTVPYRDHVVSVHLVELPEAGEAVVYLRSMIDNVWTRAARLRRNEQITLILRPWPDVAPEYDAINRSELDNLELQLQEPVWGELK